jgi:cell wall-associated NlpC family hydrolase
MADSDKDGLTDVFEGQIGTNPHDKDSDNDGLTDGAERKLGTKPMKHDSDGDGFGDGSEYAQGRTSPLHADPPPNPHVARWGVREQPHKGGPDDPDADGLDEMMEKMQGTSPNDPDSDGDGLGDGLEFIAHRDPTKPEPLTPIKSAAVTTGTDDSAVARAAATTGAAVSNRAVDTGDDTRDAFLNSARAQLGDKYQFGAETDLADTDPTAFDSSELVQWAAHQAGVELPDGSWNQYRALHEAGGAVSVEDALKTPGALVFGFSSDPLASADRPARAYVGISLGDGKVLDVSERAGEVREMGPGDFYTHAAVVPQFIENLPSGAEHPAIHNMLHPSSPLQRDMDGDGMLDVDEAVLERDPYDPNDGDQPITRPGQVDTTLGSRDDEWRRSDDEVGPPPAAGDDAQDPAAFEEPDTQEPAAFEDPAPMVEEPVAAADDFGPVEESFESFESDEVMTDV